jgi:hypothetical protein
MNLARIALFAAVCFADGLLLLRAAPAMPPKSSPRRRPGLALRTWVTQVTAMCGRWVIGER